MGGLYEAADERKLAKGDKGLRARPQRRLLVRQRKKYKKCHSAFDERLERLWEEGWEVLPRTLYKTPADIEGIKRSGRHQRGRARLCGRALSPQA